MLGISVVMAMGAARMANNWVQERMGTAANASGSSVVVAAVSIPFGRTIEAKDLRMMELPPEAVPEGSFKTIDEVVGRVSSQSLFTGEVVLAGRVAEHLGGSALAAVLEPGMRAISVRVDDVAGVAGFLLPGNLVDVVSSKRSGGNREVESRTILQQIKVLAVDQIASQEQDSPVIVRAVTLAVTPKQAERLFEATQEGRVQLTLRNPLDKSEGEVEKVAARPKPRATSAPRHRHVRVSVIRGTEMGSTNVHE
ncbi:Flp pilus assembly protein CpaB [Proteobacteria bacterium 005FR1]|nr:Flp pilus assembly protein CpaB [Proteobacteria bacterium 005FR1]